MRLVITALACLSVASFIVAVAGLPQPWLTPPLTLPVVRWLLRGFQG